MKTFSALLAICAGNSPVPGEFPTQRPVARSFDVFFDLRLNRRLNKQSWGWWFETLSRSLWRHHNAYYFIIISIFLCWPIPNLAMRQLRFRILEYHKFQPNSHNNNPRSHSDLALSNFKTFSILSTFQSEGPGMSSWDQIMIPLRHYDGVIMGAMASQITSLTIVYSTVYSDAGQRKHQSSAWIPRTNGQ